MRRLVQNTLLLAGLCLVLRPELLAEDGPAKEFQEAEESQLPEESMVEWPRRGRRVAGQGAVYVEFATALFINGLVLNGEMNLSENFAVSAGWGFSKASFVILSLVNSASATDTIAFSSF